MSTVWNIKPDKETWVFKKGDTIDLSFRVYLNNGTNPLYPKYDPFYYYDLTGSVVKIQFRRFDGLLMRTLVSSGGFPEITFITSILTILATGFITEDIDNYDIQVTDATGKVLTIGEGPAKITKEITV